MIIGEREENVIEKMQRHKKEAEKQIEGWKAELEFAMEKDDDDYKKYQEYCKFWIEVWEHTLEKLTELNVE